MTLIEARKILGLSPTDDLQSRQTELETAREGIAALVRSAANDAATARYQQGLSEFDQALETVNADALAKETQPAAPANAEQPMAIPLPSALPLPAHVKPQTPPVIHRRSWASAIWGMVLLATIGGGLWVYRENTISQQRKNSARITELSTQGNTFIENRRWQDAMTAFAEIEKITPGTAAATAARRDIEAGIAEEQTQFVGYWTGQAIAEMEVGKLTEASAAAQEILNKFPNQPEASQLLRQIDEARANQSRQSWLTAAKESLDQRKWDVALRNAQRLLALSPNDAEAAAIVKQANSGIEQTAADKIKATELFQRASALDHGQFDAQMQRDLREASLLDPANPEVAALLEKLASYTRTLHVPGDFPTPAAALAAAHDQDRIILAPQVWQGPVVINAAVDLQASEPLKTTIQCAANAGSAITIGPAAKGARIRGITFRHESFAVGNERFSVALVRGGSASFVDCRFIEASGHGLAVIEKGSALADRCRFSDNGWNGAAAIGEGSQLEVKNSEALNNYEHGIETWEGASAVLTHNRCMANSRNGIHLANGTATAIVSENELIDNREFGIVIDSAGNGAISKNIARSNLLGGYVIRAAAAALTFTGNQASLNQGAGLILEKGFATANYSDNSISNNAPLNLITQPAAAPAAIVVPESPTAR